MAGTLDDQLAALATMSPAQLRSEWLRVYKVPAPPLTSDLLARGVAWRLQERAHGGLPAATLREIRQVQRQIDRGDAVNVTQGRIKPGTRLVRDWGGTSHHVIVLESGFLYLDRSYSSLSQIARDITGAHWSGPRFFGTKRRAAEAVDA
jgi:hypothetical protein